jgi:hypothetical protein
VVPESTSFFSAALLFSFPQSLPAAAHSHLDGLFVACPAAEQQPPAAAAAAVRPVPEPRVGNERSCSWRRPAAAHQPRDGGGNHVSHNRGRTSGLGRPCVLQEDVRQTHILPPLLRQDLGHALPGLPLRRQDYLQVGPSSKKLLLPFSLQLCVP